MLSFNPPVPIVALMNALPIGWIGPPLVPAGTGGSVPAPACEKPTGVAPAVHAESGIGTVTSIGVEDAYTPLASSVIVVCTMACSAKTCTPCGVAGAAMATQALAWISLSPALRIPRPWPAWAR